MKMNRASNALEKPGTCDGIVTKPQAMKKSTRNMPREKSMPPADSSPREQMKIVLVGHVDHGKSTLVGRLLYDTGSLLDGKFEQIQQSCARRGMPFEWSFLMDALQAERDQGITIDTSQIWFKTAKRNYVIIDAPGHKEFLKNMVSGAAASDAALLVIDAKEGVKEQSKRHAYLLHLLGIKQVAVLINKMDAVGYSQHVFASIEQQYREYLKTIGVTPSFVIPVSAREGDHVTGTSTHMPWYKGPCVTSALDHFARAPVPNDLPLRFPVQDIYKFDDRRIIVGRVESGQLAVGDELLFSPSNRHAKVASIEAWSAKPPSKIACAGESIGITLAEHIFVERGHVASHKKRPPILTNMFRARLFWLGAQPLTAGNRYKLKIATNEISAEVTTVEQVIDTDTLSRHQQPAVERGAVAEVLFRVRGLAAVDAFADLPSTGRFVIVEGHTISGGGIIDLDGFVDQRVKFEGIKSRNITALDLRITPQQRARSNGHTGAILWLTGLPSSGKSTLALELQQRLFAKGYHVYILDGDNIRGGLNKDLGFSADDRSENIRRVGEVAGLFAQSGAILICAFISPYREDRKRALAVAPEYFHTIYIKADLKTCEQRDTRGLYKKARSGKIKDFTGISAPYEEPDNPDLVIDTAKLSIEQSVELLFQYVQKQCVEPVKTLRDIPQGRI
jgi:bifunctional enzyme CysN/CysC